jgi:hypothetical protein
MRLRVVAAGRVYAISLERDRVVQVRTLVQFVLFYAGEALVHVDVVKGRLVCSRCNLQPLKLRHY